MGSQFVSTDLVQACLAAEGLQSSVALVLKPSTDIVHTPTVDPSITALLAQMLQMRADDKVKADAAQAQFLQIRADDLLKAEAATKAAALLAQEQINLLADQFKQTSQSQTSNNNKFDVRFKNAQVIFKDRIFKMPNHAIDLIKYFEDLEQQFLVLKTEDDVKLALLNQFMSD